MAIYIWHHPFCGNCVVHWNPQHGNSGSERHEDLDFGPALEEDGFVKEGEDPHCDPVDDDGGDLAIYKYVYINIDINIYIYMETYVSDNLYKLNRHFVLYIEFYLSIYKYIYIQHVRKQFSYCMWSWIPIQGDLHDSTSDSEWLHQQIEAGPSEAF